MESLDFPMNQDTRTTDSSPDINFSKKTALTYEGYLRSLIFDFLYVMGDNDPGFRHDSVNKIIKYTTKLLDLIIVDLRIVDEAAGVVMTQIRDDAQELVTALTKEVSKGV